MWLPPSRGQRFWLRHAPRLFAPSDRGSAFIRWWAIATVTPSTNVTGLNLPYQAYLDAVFHRTRLARVGHAVCMPVIVASLLAALDPITLVGAVLLAVWWGSWALIWRDALWGTCAVGLAGGLYAATFVVAALPWPAVVTALVGSLLQAASHALEPLPPRVTRSTYWVPVGTYLREGPGTRPRRIGHLAAQLVFGTVDELVASPRLQPVLLLRLLWFAGHDAGRREQALDLARRAIASGNPALDFVGTGGSTPVPVS
jgi:hypothetical protein